MTSTTPELDQSRFGPWDVVFLVVCLVVFAFAATELLLGVPEKFRNQHWALFLLSLGQSSNLLSKLSTRLWITRSLRALALVSLLALFALMFLRWR